MPNGEEFCTKRLSQLCRIKLSEEEQKKFNKNLEKILKYMDLIDEIDTENVQPCTHVLETINNVMREDKEDIPLERETFLRNAPDQVGGMVKVPPVIQFEE